MIFWYFFFLVILIYICTFLAVSIACIIRPCYSNFSIEAKTFISVIIAFRDEEKYLSPLLSSLKKQTYHQEYFEVIFANDHSNDNSANIIREQLSGVLDYKIIELEENKKGKKEALLLAAEHAQGELLVFTDADCTVNENWLTLFNNFYCEKSKPSMIIGLVDNFDAQGLLSEIFRLEFLSLVITGAGMTALKMPVFANGANLAVRRKDYLEENYLKNDFSSGDDVFLLHQLKGRRKKIELLNSAGSVVHTAAPNSFKEFVNQRIRWGSKARAYTDGAAIFLTLLVFTVNIFVVSALVLSLLQHSLFFFFSGLGAKISADMLVFISATKIFKLKWRIFLIPLVSIFYPFYLVTTAFIAIKKPFEWKGRKLLK
ncbi:MAG: glycosyltransferase [Bacteroidales bacterium]|nr:glycosyltransferase [Bacteroidales bacterium]MBN2818890.1 glycosyltransferase [Bacteroidales bacterium]